MGEVLLDLIVVLVLSRAFWSLLGKAMARARTPGPRSRQTPERGVQMVRDPVCGTFVVPEHALSIADRHERVYFCSPACRDRYRARTA